MIFLGEAIRGLLGGLLLSSDPPVAFFVDPLRPFIKLPQCAERFSVSSRLTKDATARMDRASKEE